MNFILLALVLLVVWFFSSLAIAVADDAVSLYVASLPFLISLMLLPLLISALNDSLITLLLCITAALILVFLFLKIFSSVTLSG